MLCSLTACTWNPLIYQTLYSPAVSNVWSQNRHHKHENKDMIPTFLTLLARPSRWAQAAVAIDLVYTGGARGTGGRLALVYVWKRGVKGMIMDTPYQVIFTHTQSPLSFNGVRAKSKFQQEVLLKWKIPVDIFFFSQHRQRLLDS